MKKFEDMLFDEKAILISAAVAGYELGYGVGYRYGVDETRTIYGWHDLKSSYAESTKASYDTLKSGVTIDRKSTIDTINGAISRAPKKVSKKIRILYTHNPANQMKKFEDMSLDEKEILISSFIISYEFGNIVGYKVGNAEIEAEETGVATDLGDDIYNISRSCKKLKDGFSEFIDIYGCVAAINNVKVKSHYIHFEI